MAARIHKEALAAGREPPQFVIQGDCAAIISYFAGHSKLHRSELVHALDRAWATIAALGLRIRWAYIPRCGNSAADSLAGTARDTAIAATAEMAIGDLHASSAFVDGALRDEEADITSQLALPNLPGQHAF